MNDFTKDNIINVHFPLNDVDIIKILKGVQFNQTVYLENGQRLHIQVYSSDRVKHISMENWKKIVSLCYGNPDLENLIRFIETED